jgi:hypothetical protein
MDLPQNPSTLPGGFTRETLVSLPLHHLVEGLGHNLSLAKRKGDIKGIILHSKEEALSHLQFVDDMLLMGLPMVKEDLAFKRTLDLFNLALGTIIN